MAEKNGNGLAVIQPQDMMIVDEWNDARREFIRKAFCGGAPDDIATTFLMLCERRRLSPEARHVYLVNRAKKGDPPNFVIQTGIDGYRLIADRTGRYAGSDDPIFEHGDQGRPLKATVTVRKMLANGTLGSFTASARWDEYAAGSTMWSKMPHTMLAKCAEALALRKAFPEELSGMYTDAEMDQAEHAPAPAMPATHAVVPQDASNDPNRMTEPQRRKIWSMAQDLGMDVDALHKFAAVDSLSDLSKREASDLIAALDAAIGAAMGDE